MSTHTRFGRVTATVAVAALALIGVVAFPQAASAATFFVDDLSDDGSSDTLRGAIDAANLTTGADTIEIRVPGTITLNTSSVLVTSGVFIRGATTGAGTTITRDFTGDLFQVAMAPTSTDRDFIALGIDFDGTGGTFTGRAVNVTNTQPARNVGFYDSTLSGFAAAGNGGAVFAQGLTGGFIADNADFSLNSSGGSGGSVCLSNVAGAIEFTSVTMEATTAAVFGGGAYINSPTSAVAVVDSEISTAVALSDAGGGMFINTAASTRVQNSTFASNRSQNAGGGLFTVSTTTTITDSDFVDNVAAGNFGGGVYVGIGTVTITGSRFLRNSSGESSGSGGGGGLAAGYSRTLTSLRIIDSEFTANVSTQGGAVFVDNYTADSWIQNSTFTDNIARTLAIGGGSGGAVSFGTTTGGIPAPFTITASTFRGNNAYRGTGAPTQQGRGGAIFTRGTADRFLIEDSLFADNLLGGYTGFSGVSVFVSTQLVQDAFDIVNTTFVEPSDNVAVSVDGFAPGGDFVVSHSTFDANHAIIIADNGSGANSRASHVIFNSGPAYQTIFVAGGAPLTVEWSLLRRSADPLHFTPTNTVLSVPNMMLGSLQDNGGPTQTKMLLPGSPAIDTGNPAAVLLPAYDQRQFGFDRVINNVVDIGAVEAPKALAPTGATINPVIPIAGGALLLLGVGAIIVANRRRRPSSH